MDSKEFQKHLEKAHEFHAMSIPEQLNNKARIIKWFKSFWDIQPTETEFDMCISEIVIFPVINYYMVKNQ